MWETILAEIAVNGIWALLFLGMLVHQLRDSKSREDKYQEMILGLSKSLKSVDLAVKGVDDIKQILLSETTLKKQKNVEPSPKKEKIAVKQTAEVAVQTL